VIVLPALDDDGRSGFEDLMNHANEVLAEMVDDGTIKADERSRMVVAAYPRRRRDLLAPFERDGLFQHLVVEHCELSVLSDAAWADYERDQNKDVLASRYARFFRSTFAPSLILGLTHVGDAEERRSFADRLEDGLKRRFTSRPAPLNSFVQAIVLAKQ
jgi:hypothetical protein